MSSENWQDFEVKCINDACVRVCVRACLCLQRRLRGSTAMVTLLCSSLGLATFSAPPPKAAK